MPVTQLMQDHFNAYCREHLFNNDQLIVGDMLYYPSLALCALDAVMSIRLDYHRQVVPVLENVCNAVNIPFILTPTIPPVGQQVRVSDFVLRLENLGLWTVDDLRGLIHNYMTAGSRQIYKADAFIQFIQMIQDAGVETYQDLNGLDDVVRHQLEINLKTILGQKVSVDYFFMLAGEPFMVKVDTWLRRFSQEATGVNDLTNQDIVDLFCSAAEILSAENNQIITPRHLDHAAWTYKRA